jgi:type I restriction enzyme, S subunit
LRMGNLDHDSVSLDLADIQRVAPPEGAEGTRTRVQHGDILISITADVGMTGLVPSTLEKAFISQHVALARPVPGIRPAYLAWYLASESGGQKQFKALQRGATKVGLGLDDINAVRVPVAPLAEQELIVELIDELLSDLDAGVAALKRLQAKLMHYRAAVLKAAVDGALTADWRTQHPNTESASDLLQRIVAERRRRWEQAQLQQFERSGKEPPKDWKTKYKQPRRLVQVSSRVLPSSWLQTGFEELSDGLSHSLKAGPFGSALKKEFYTSTGYKIYGQEQVIRGDAFYGNYFIDQHRFDALKSCAVKPGDLLISLVGTTGKVLVLPHDIAPGIINPRLLKVSLLPGNVHASFIKLVLEGPQARAFFKAKAHGGTMDILNLGILK